MDDDSLGRIRRLVSEAMEERRGLVVNAGLRPAEMDRLARRVEREALDRIEHILEGRPESVRAAALRNRLGRMRDELEHLDALGPIEEASRQMESDDIVWRAFEDIAGWLGMD